MLSFQVLLTMSKTPHILDKLKLIGFTEYTSRAYLALVKLGEATAPDIARESNIPQSKIYGVLDDLYDKGFVGKAAPLNIGMIAKLKHIKPDSMHKNRHRPKHQVKQMPC